MNEQSIVGTWALVEAWDIGDNPSDPTQKTYPWGNPPAGYWVYDSSGHFSLMISQNPALPIPADPFSTSSPPQSQSGWLTPAPPWTVPYDLLIATFATANPYAYFGTYTVELDDQDPHLGGTILHTVFSDVLRVYTGTVQKRTFLFDGHDFLNVGTPGQYLRRLQRLT
ncbi:MAG TPA: lipocalin-like domain-containing protein [Thermoanaerobaculia bacterium]|nr:lipocalin-like domain-containing protein [Thermoanaerobaculia bacterium]